MVTDFGKELRKIRIDRDERLMDMADKIGKSSAFISAVEIGKKSPPQGFEEVIARVYNLTENVKENLKLVADRARKSFTIEPHSILGRDTAGLMARHMNELSEEQLREIHAILTKNKEV
ncbi:helix-turn-helix domain-containing protein [Acetobacter thailandicus]|uniref:helix-turn-helix domain-containing protein n=1 Tax=Acetobacter thailandicus TaxID=1502842 RepID=UPI001BA4F28D|nr:helix-turn-helix domain-containing protein [Acetobacter thailandicus]MBS0986616.1 helix-turn-helix transcriptional regulator [Acetobacter thailandicus]